MLPGFPHLTSKAARAPTIPPVMTGPTRDIRISSILFTLKHTPFSVHSIYLLHTVFKYQPPASFPGEKLNNLLNITFCDSYYNSCDCIIRSPEREGDRSKNFQILIPMNHTKRLSRKGQPFKTSYISLLLSERRAPYPILS